MNRHPRSIWILLADASQARIIEVSTGDSEQPDLETAPTTPDSPGRTGPPGSTKARPFRATLRGREQARLANTFPEPQRHRPHRTSAAGHTLEFLETDAERLRRFAKEITQWIAGQVDGSLLGQLTAFAPAKLLSHFRDMFRKEGLGAVHLKEGNFIYMSAAQVANHPQVTELFEPASARA